MDNWFHTPLPLPSKAVQSVLEKQLTLISAVLTDYWRYNDEASHPLCFSMLGNSDVGLPESGYDSCIPKVGDIRHYLSNWEGICQLLL